jgi:hypothetical protein
MAQPRRPEAGRRDDRSGEVGRDKLAEAADETSSAEERGERVETGRTVARGGKSKGNVPGAHEQNRGKGTP